MAKTIKETVEKTQDIILQALLQEHPVRPRDQFSAAVSDNILSEIQRIPEEKIKESFGSFNPQMLFLRSINLSHPDVDNFYSQAGWGDFNKTALATMRGQSPQKEFSEKCGAFLRGIASVKPRLVGDTTRRSQMRTTKNRVQSLSMKRTDVVGENAIYSQPLDFSSHIRHSTLYNGLADVFDDNEKTFKSYSMPEVAGVFKKRAESMRSLIKERYLGFNRLQLVDAAIVCARMHGLKWTEANNFTVPHKFFQKKFWNEAAQKISDDKNEAVKAEIIFPRKKGSPIPTEVGSAFFSYQPRVYPIGAFTLPDRAARIINQVDNLPELNGNPAFDVYWVVVPSVNVNSIFLRAEDKWKISIDGINHEFTEEAAATDFLDRLFIKEKIFTPVIMGERDGRCYFICMMV